MVSPIATGKRRARWAGFTLIELLVVLAIMAALLTLVVPRYFKQTERAHETVLRHNLLAMRDAIDKFHGDLGRYPSSLDELASQQYLREVPLDPITGRRDSWRIQAPANQAGVFDVHSGAAGQGSDGSDYAQW
ncbi:type II secretion system protein [Chitinimonas taiwanensis]|uniref:General secretion pathway protein G n=1 Tax=Chitinimonas taiwanensis DSM 18899 TaxID=1121279 RepID=A0A1K2HRU8_9NEIS|nr:prepilin-type N-terminal cleavage/methylation domain-containing protein [Chitinimonas taiwanensis]SFZ79421.1 general secretion pathway protein G [Chitinimonas taiwanensis DSM 18899]